MTNQIVRVIHDFAIAEQVRDDFLAAGFGKDAVVLSPVGDEAGPGQSNFTVGDSSEAKGGTDYNDVFRPEGDVHGACILKIMAIDASEEDMANAIFARHHAGAPDAMSAHGVP